MRVFITILILIFSLQSWTKADDIRDYQLYNMSIGDSALEYYSESKIKANKENWYKNKKVTPVSIEINGKDYDTVSFSYWTNDENYTIIDVTGMKMYPNNINQCYKEKKDQVKIIKTIKKALQ